MTAAESAATVRDNTKRLRDMIGFALAERNIPHAPTWTLLAPQALDNIDAALDALLAQAEAAAEYPPGTTNLGWHLTECLRTAEAERDAAVRAAEQAQEALRPFVEDYDFRAADYLSDDDEARVFTARTVESLIAHQRAARAALTGEGTNRVMMDATDQQAIADAGLPVRCCDNWPECSHVAAALTGEGTAKPPPADPRLIVERPAHEL